MAGGYFFVGLRLLIKFLASYRLRVYNMVNWKKGDLYGQRI